MRVPYFRPQLDDAEVREVEATLRSGWLTTGPRVERFEEAFRRAVGAGRAVATNSCTAALHLAVEALGLEPGQFVLVPTMTFAATAEIVRYRNAVPLLVDCTPETLNLDLGDAEKKIARLAGGELPCEIPETPVVAGIIPVHVGGLMSNPDAMARFAADHGLWIVEDAAHAFPAAWRRGADGPWIPCGAATADVSCFSFYANKTITTGEGGMAVTERNDLAARMRLMALHGLSRDAWARYAGGSGWDYRIVAPGFKYNLTDVAAAIGLHQLEKADAMRRRREEIAELYISELAEIEEIELPPQDSDRIHAWHLFPIRLRLDRLTCDRNGFVDRLEKRGVGFSVHWRPLHEHPYYRDTFGWTKEDFPVASAVWRRLVSLPIFSDMRTDECAMVVEVVRDLCRTLRRVR